MHVCHSCDNTLCINPMHLWIGTDAQNAKVKVMKGTAIGASRLVQAS